MLKKRLLLGALLSIVLVTAGCGTSAPKAEAGAASASSAPASGGSGPNSPVTPQPTSPPASTTVVQGNPDQGKQLFDSNCASCHAVDDQKIVGPGLKGIYGKSALPNNQPVNDANLAQWMKTGDAQMPGNPAMSAQDEANISSYLKTLK